MFTHLHVHSHYSLLDGLPKIPDLINHIQKQGMTAVALTDHGSLYGALEFYKQAKREGIKPIIGIEAYVAPGSLKEKRSPADADYFHMILLAKNNEGYQNLLKLVTVSHLEGYYYKPRIDKETLRSMSRGLVGLSGCLRGAIPRALLSNNAGQAKKLAEQYAEIFEPGQFYLEVQRNMPDEQKTLNEGLVRLARETGLPLVATNDAHYIAAGDNPAQDILVCIGTGTTVGETDRLDMRGAKLHLAGAEEMAALFADLPEAVANTMKIADSVDLDLVLEKRHFPNFPVPDDVTPDAYIEALCREGLARHYGDKIPDEISKRLN